MMFARLDFSTFLVCCSGNLSDNESEEKLSVAICGGSMCILTELFSGLASMQEYCEQNEKYDEKNSADKAFDDERKH